MHYVVVMLRIGSVQDKARGESARRGTRPPAVDNKDTRAKNCTSIFLVHQNTPIPTTQPVPSRSLTDHS
jgi:hypothetical protein